MNKFRKFVLLTCLSASLSNVFADNLISNKKVIKCSYNESNVNTVIGFENAVLNYLTADGSLDEVNKYLSDTYIQHYPLSADGVSGLKSYLTDLKKNNAFKNTKIETYSIFGCNDYVTIENIFYSPKNKFGTAAINTFRVNKNKIVEHWEVVQPLQEPSKNTNGVF